MPDSSPRLLAALHRARAAAENHMRVSDRFQLPWAEETVTDLLLVAASPEVRAVPFTKREEGGREGTGSDWLWWWIGDEGVSFGALVQAKRLKKKPSGRWSIDFGYKSGQQRANLRATAEALQLAPVYALYFGTPEFRQPLTCDRTPHTDSPLDCERCARKTVSLLPAILAMPGGGVDNNPAEAFERAVPIEDLVDADASIPRPLVLPKLELGLDLEALLFQPQSGPRKVAQALIEQACRIRFGQFSAMTEDAVEQVSEDYTFPTLPNDEGHMVEPYFPNILRGLRNSPPGYVLDILSSNDSPRAINAPTAVDDAGLEGIVIVDFRT